jgi:molybdopterin molybdotransferase
VPPGAGPLAALLAGVDAATIALGREPDLVLLVACDLPNVDEALLTTLRDAPGAPTVVPQAAGRLQFACARYGTDAVTAARAAWSAGERSLRAVFDLVPYDVLEVPDALLADVDTPADCARFGIARPG